MNRGLTAFDDLQDDETFAEEYIEEDVLDSILSEEALLLLDEYKNSIVKGRTETSDSNIKVSEVLGSIAFLYEKIRNAIDYKSEHLLRKNAIERILRRSIWENKGKEPKELADGLIRELIWGRYLKNNFIPKKIAGEIEVVLSKYQEIERLLTSKENQLKPGETKDWFMGICACEIDELLDPNFYFREALCKSLYFWFKSNFNWQDNGLSEDDKDVQIFIAIQRSIAKADSSCLRYALLKVYYPPWKEITSINIDRIFGVILKIREEIERHLDSPVQPKMYRFVQKQAAAFLILKEVIEDDIEKAEEIMIDPPRLEKKVRKITGEKYDDIRKKVNTGIKRSIIYIFATKIIFAFLIEIPYEYFFLEKLNFLALSVNLLLPPTLMFMLGVSIRKPGKENTERIVDKINSFVYRRQDTEKINFSLNPQKRNTFLSQVFLIFYTIIFLITFGGISYLLLGAGFNLISAGIFFGFLSLVLLFSYRVRYTASELNVTGEKEGFLAHIFTNLSLPLLNLGVWLSRGLSKLNFLVVIMDFLIEAPLKNIISVFEEWTSFIREKKEEVVEVPN
jgi:hypothetical protein